MSRNSLWRMYVGQPQWVVDEMKRLRATRLALRKIFSHDKIPSPRTMTKAQCKALMESHRWDILGAYFKFRPAFLTLPSNKPVFDWSSCPNEMADLLRNPAAHKPKPTRCGGYSRSMMYQQQHKICFYCGKVTEWKHWTIDHKLPVSRGGGNGDNKVGCCYTCNHAKGNMTVEEFLATDYLPDERREDLGFPDPPTIRHKEADRKHRERLGSVTGIGSYRTPSCNGTGVVWSQ